MSIFDPFNQAKLQQGLSKVRNATIPEKDMSLDELKRLSGGRRPLYPRRKTYRRKPRSKKTRKQ